MAEDMDLGNGVSAGETTSSEDANDFDMAGALEEVSSGLGLGGDTDDDTGAADSGGEGKPAEGTVPVKEEGEGAPASTDTETTSVPDAPKTWRPEAVKAWKDLPETVRVEVLKREEDMFRGIESYKADASIGKVIKDIVAPYIPGLRAKGLDPVHQIRSLLASNEALENGTPEQKVMVLRKLAEIYNVDISGEGASPYVDPQISTLNKTIDELRSRLDTNDNRMAESVKANLQKEVNAFADDPAHPYFDEVAADVAALLKGKVATTLEEAYEKAVWLNPVTRAKEAARATTEAAAKAKSEAEAKAAAAKKASSANVKTSTKPGRGTAPVGSMDDTLNETLTHIRKRA